MGYLPYIQTTTVNKRFPFERTLSTLVPVRTQMFRIIFRVPGRALMFQIEHRCSRYYKEVPVSTLVCAHIHLSSYQAVCSVEHIFYATSWLSIKFNCTCSQPPFAGSLESVLEGRRETAFTCSAVLLPLTKRCWQTECHGKGWGVASIEWI